jgi:hypothetical protein
MPKNNYNIADKKLKVFQVEDTKYRKPGVKKSNSEIWTYTKINNDGL